MNRQHITLFNYLRCVVIAALWVFCFLASAKRSLANKLVSNNAFYEITADSTRFNITGRVIDETGQPVPGATVFIANSKWSAGTDNQGVYNINGIPAGNYEVLVRMMGYITFTKVFSITDKSIAVNVTLKPDAIALNEVKITAKPDGNRARYLKTFTDAFIGQSDNAKKSKIINSDVIRFQFINATGTLTARSTDFIKIENTALGYNVNYLLNSFSFNQHDQTVTYDGNIYFEELAGDEKKQKEWKDNRLATYNGSVQHFFRALFTGTTEAEGFKVYKIADSELGQSLNFNISVSTRSRTPHISHSPIDKANLKPVKPNSLFNTVGVTRILNMPLLVKDGDTTRFYICYERNGEPSRFLNSGAHLNIPVQNAQISRIYQLYNNVILNKNGTLTPQKSLMLEGFWGWKRVGDVLPEEMLPATNVNAQNVAVLTDKPATTEKIHVQTDRPWYLTGDTAWLKVYVVDANNKPLNDGKICFVELIDANKRIIKNLRLPLNAGMAWGELSLNDSLVKKGAYLLRVYTNSTQKNGNNLYYKTLRVVDINSSPVNTTSIARAKQQLVSVTDSLKLQFFPEGGGLVNEVNRRIALMVTTAEKPVNKMSGYIADEIGSHIAKFETNEFGIATFNLKPQKQGKYWAVFTLPNGKEKRFALPKAQPSGVGMVVKQNTDNIIANLTSGNIDNNIRLSLIVKAKGGIQFQAERLLSPAGDSVVISKTEIPQGILQFELYAENNLVAERMVYNQNKRQQLEVKLTANKTTYHPHDKVDINMVVTDNNGNPVSGNFSVSVNNEADVPVNGGNENTILADLLMPGNELRKLKSNDLMALTASQLLKIDNLLLTIKQGKPSVNITSNNQSSTHVDTTLSAIKGAVSSAKGKPAEASVVGLFFPTGGPTLTAISDKNGRFFIDNVLVKRGDPYYIVAKDKNKDLTVTVDKYEPPVIPDNVLADTAELDEYTNYIFKRITELKGSNILGTALKEVLIKAKAAEPTLKEVLKERSSNMGGQPDQVITFIDMLDCNTTSLGGCLALKVHGVALVGDTNMHRPQLILRRNAAPMAVFVNGIEQPEALRMLSVSEIATVEVLKGANAAAYGMLSGNGVVVITTKTGGLDYWAYEQEHYVPGSTKKPAVRLYRFETGFDIAKDFYLPDYRALQKNAIDKWRPTVYWNPNTITAANGTAQFSYFTNSVPGKYRITIEGVDGTGRIARQVLVYKVTE